MHGLQATWPRARRCMSGGVPSMASYCQWRAISLARPRLDQLSQPPHPRMVAYQAACKNASRQIFRRCCDQAAHIHRVRWPTCRQRAGTRVLALFALGSACQCSWRESMQEGQKRSSSAVAGLPWRCRMNSSARYLYVYTVAVRVSYTWYSVNSKYELVQELL